MAPPVVSLNEKQRRQEKAEAEARLEARKKDRSSRHAPHETRYEITVKNAGQPGLPKPWSAASRSPEVDDSDADVEAPDPVPADKDLAFDSTLEETQRILLDYIGLLHSAPNPTLARHFPDRTVGAPSHQ
jgi:hypothetical protein